MEWINVKDRLPEDDTIVLVLDNKDVYQGFYAGGCWYWYNPFDDISGNCYVTHWIDYRPLPQSTKL